MARRRPAKGTPQQRTLLTIHPYAAGIDIGSRFHVVAVPPDLDPEPVRTYQSFTEDLHRMADWFVELGITTVAMESTGIYWIPAFEILEARGIEVLLVKPDMSKMSRVAKPMSTTPTGSSNCISMDSSVAVSGRLMVSPPSGRTFDTASACWSMRPPISNICKKR
jgi:hypothetical protein